MGAALERLFPLNEFTDSTDFYESNLRQAKMVTQLAINFYRRACTEEDIYLDAFFQGALLRSICEQADCLDEDTSYTLNTYKAMTASAEFFEVLFDRFSIVVTEPSSLATKDINIHTLNTTKNLRDFLIESVEVELLAHGLPDKLIAGYTHGLFSRDGFGKRLGRRQINDMLTIMPLGKLAELM